MLVGSVGTGKTSLVQGFLRDNASDTLLSCTINTSYYTDAAAMQRQLEQPLDKVWWPSTQGKKHSHKAPVCTKPPARHLIASAWFFLLLGKAYHAHTPNRRRHSRGHKSAEYYTSSSPRVLILPVHAEEWQDLRPP